MGIEYHIKFKKPENFSLGDFLAHIENPMDDSGWPAFMVQEIDEGIYFCDHGRSMEASIAFRKIVDRALLFDEKVMIAEL